MTIIQSANTENLTPVEQGQVQMFRAILPQWMNSEIPLLKESHGYDAGTYARKVYNWLCVDIPKLLTEQGYTENVLSELGTYLAEQYQEFHKAEFE